MDLLFVEDGRIVIVDYKTDAVEPDGVEAAVATHRSQAEIYAAAAHQTTGLAVAEVVFVFCRVGLDGACRWE
jgi:ATP-dependent helicase/nuclease subunit A